MNGCNAYNLSFHPAVAETGVKRVLMTPSEGNQYIVGSSVSVGTGNSRGETTAYDTVDICEILSIENVEISGTQYVALNLDTTSTFDSTTALFVLTQSWKTGATDNVKGNDGSPFSNTSNKEPFKLQGIELMVGVMEVAGSETADQTAEQYTLYSNRKAAEITAGGKGQNPVTLGNVQKTDQEQWRYIAELNWQNEPDKYFVPIQYNGTSSTGYRDCVYTDSTAITSGARECLMLGRLDSGSFAGLSCLHLTGGLGLARWFVSGRACGSAGNRGEFQTQG